MRTVLIPMIARIFTVMAVVALAISLTSIAPSRADADAPYCLENSGSSGSGKRCDYFTLAQCQATARGLNGSCVPNPWYAYGESSGQRARSGRY